MASAVHLTLLIGPQVPVPAPRLMIDALESAKVTSVSGGTGGVELRFKVSSKSELNTIFLVTASQHRSIGMPPLRVVLIVTLNGKAQPLFDGVITNVQVQAGQQGQAGSITVIGVDLTSLMNMQDFSGLPYPAMGIEERVSLICAKYAAYGVIPMVMPTLFRDMPLPIDRIPAHQGTDLSYVQQMAGEVGYVFYIEPGDVPMTNIAYFGKEIKAGMPQPALNVDMDAHTNVEDLDFTFDPTKGVLPIIYIQNQLTRTPIPVPIPAINPLQPPLGLLPTPIVNIRKMKDTAKMNAMQALSKGFAEAGKSQDSVSAKGSLDVLRYGRLLKARKLVGVRGAGIAYDGLYYVQSVTTTLKRGELKQNFQLTRNGLVSITPRVPA